VAATVKSGRRSTTGPAVIFFWNRQSEPALKHGCHPFRVVRRISPHLAFGFHRAEILHGGKLRSDIVRYTEWVPEGLVHHFAVESDDLKLKTRVAVVRSRDILL
jgi:hypothetical protein